MESYYFNKFDNRLNSLDYIIHNYPLWSYTFRALLVFSFKPKGFE